MERLALIALVLNAGGLRPVVQQPRPAEIRGEGHLDGGAVQRVIAQHQGLISACYERELLRQPALSGKVALVWSVAPSGQAPEVSVDRARSTLFNDSVIGCLLRAGRTWRFPAPQGGAVTVEQVFLFQAFEDPSPGRREEYAHWRPMADVPPPAPPPAPRPPPLFEVSGGMLDFDQVQGAVRSRLPAVAGCLELELLPAPSPIQVALSKAMGPRMPGNKRHWALVTWRVAEDGSAHGARVTEGSLDDGVQRCVAEEIGRWRFPRPRGGAAIVTYRFECTVDFSEGPTHPHCLAGTGLLGVGSGFTR